MRKTAQAIVFAVILSGLPATATACGMCMFGVVEYTFPHTMFWCLGITIWFCVVGIITAPKKFVTDLIAVFVIFFLGTAFFGPFPFGLLALIACTRTISGFLSSTKKTMSRKSKQGLLLITVAVSVAILAGFAINTHTLNTRTDAEFILSWGGYKGKAVLHKLISDPEQHEAQLRRILAQTGDEYMIKEISKALEK